MKAKLFNICFVSKGNPILDLVPQGHFMLCIFIGLLLTFAVITMKSITLNYVGGVEKPCARIFVDSPPKTIFLLTLECL